MKFGNIIITVLLLLIVGCASSGTGDKNQQRSSVLQMKDEVLTELFRLKPDTRKQINNAPGYAVFSNVNVNIIFASFGGGYGVAKNMQTGIQTYMKMGEVGFGLGAGVKDFRAVFVFHTKSAFNRFVESGWEFGGHADAAAKASEHGGAVSAEALIDDVTIYQITKNGLALQATLKGTKYWKDDSLN